LEKQRIAHKKKERWESVSKGDLENRSTFGEKRGAELLRVLIEQRP